jgi:protein-tyrosine-phosphatase/DNA-binding transcriptional ArsR family regulator
MMRGASSVFTVKVSLQERAARHAALGDPVRLAIVDELVRSDRSPGELRRLVNIESNLLAHHLDVLEGVGMIYRSRSSGDGRRRYVHLVHGVLIELIPGEPVAAEKALFVCSANSARSQLAAALWRTLAGAPAESAGTHPAAQIHPSARAAAKRAGLDLGDAMPKSLDAVRKMPEIVVTVCDQAHEELEPDDHWLHWSIPDPVADGSKEAFDNTLSELRLRIAAILPESTVA